MIVLIGPSGCGKTEVGQRLAEVIGARFLDADDFHTPEAKAQMHAGHPLSDAERHPWLARIRKAALEASAGSEVVLACSALKPELRQDLERDGGAWTFVALDVPPGVLRKRLANRQGHFFPASMLDSQLADWHPPEPEEGIVVNGNQPVEDVVQAIRDRLKLPRKRKA